MWDYRARLVDVVDADTVTLEVDQGFDTRHVVTVRLEGVFAVERSHSPRTASRAASAPDE